MKRELWAIAKSFISGVQILNSISCQNDNEKEVTEDDKWLVAEQINSDCSVMMIEDVEDMITMIRSLPQGRLCERTDCSYHHPEKNFKEKCLECIDNSKCQKPELNISHFEDF